MSWLITLIVGAVVGILAGLLIAKDRGRSILANAVLGIIGAIAGYWLFIDVLGLGPRTAALNTWSWAGLIWEIVGTLVVLGIINALTLPYTSEDYRTRRATAHDYKDKDRDQWKKK